MTMDVFESFCVCVLFAKMKQKNEMSIKHIKVYDVDTFHGV